jgi:hypothetical protein
MEGPGFSSAAEPGRERGALGAETEWLQGLTTDSAFCAEAAGLKRPLFRGPRTNTRLIRLDTNQVAEINMEMLPTPTYSWRDGLTVPVLLIVPGILFLLDQLVPGWGIHRTWPVLLVALGILKLLDSTRPPRPPKGPNI